MKWKEIYILVLFVLMIGCLSSCDQTRDDMKNNADQSETSDLVTDDVSVTVQDTQATEHKHIEAKGVRENAVAPTCETAGSYDEVVYCAECDEELSRTKKSIKKRSHNYKNGICVYCQTPKGSEGLQFTSAGNGTCTLSGIGNCKDRDIIVPPVSPRGDRVTAISDSAFYNHIALNSIYIPESVTSIGNNAFAYCANLKTVVLSDNITSWGNGVFAGCASLQCKKSRGLSYVGSERNPYLVLVEAHDKTRSEYEVHSKTVFISNHAFSSCSDALNIVIGEGVMGIGSCAFQNCSALVSITLPPNLTEISGSLFMGCSGLESVHIPMGITVIKNHAFAFCENLRSIELPEGLTKIETAAFYFCSKLTEVSIPNTVVEIQEDVFKDCSSVCTVSLPGGITEIEDGLFKNCSSLESVAIPSGVKEIGRYAFENCTSLERIVIPAAVKTIWYSAFRNCPNLKGVRFEQADGWQCFDAYMLMVDLLDLTNEEQNASYLNFEYDQYTWKRN